MLSALVLAAGQSRRMGNFKILLPWQNTTVLGQIIATLAAAGVPDIVVVTGHRAPDVAAALASSGPLSGGRAVHNPRYAEGEMLSSIQAGLAAMNERAEAALLCLGDQPQMQEATVRAVMAAGAAGDWQHIIIPSYQMHAGHPILLPRCVWPAILETSDTLRTALSAFRPCTRYLVVDTSTVLTDLDTPEDYERERSLRGDHL